MKVLTIFPTSVNELAIEEAAAALREGEMLVYPTDTVYAMACSSLNQGAIERLCKLKGIDARKETLSVVCSGISQASEYARIDNRAYRVIRENTPGAFTFILPAATTLPKVFKGRKTVGVRIPDNAIARALAQELGNPLLTTAVEDEEGVAVVTEAMNVGRRWSSAAKLLIDGGEVTGELSTIVDLTDSSNVLILRDGAGLLK